MVVLANKPLPGTNGADRKYRGHDSAGHVLPESKKEKVGKLPVLVPWDLRNLAGSAGTFSISEISTLLPPSSL